MTSFLENIRRLGRDTAIDLIKSAQPQLDFRNGLAPLVERIENYVKGTLKAIDFLGREKPEKLDLPLIELLIAGTGALIISSLFITSLGWLLAAAVTCSPQYLMNLSFSLFLAGAMGYGCIQLVKEADAVIRYEAITTGFRLAFQ